MYSLRETLYLLLVNTKQASLDLKFVEVLETINRDSPEFSSHRVAQSKRFQSRFNELFGDDAIDTIKSEMDSVVSATACKVGSCFFPVID